MQTLHHPETLQQIITRIQSLQPDAQARWGKMNVGQMLCHITDPFRDILQERKTSMTVPFFLRPFVKWYVLRKSRFAKNIITMKPFRQGGNGTGTTPGEFAKDKSELLRLIQRFAATDDKFDFGPHPGAGLLTREQYGYLQWKHLDHHLRQFGV